MKEVSFKTILVGDVGCGKTSIFNRIKRGEFSSVYSSTIGVDFSKYIINKDKDIYKLHIWDTSGQERFNCIISSYYRDISVAVIVFDVCDRQSFNNIQKWIDEIKKYSNDKIVFYIVANKIDLTRNRVVFTSEIEYLCNTLNIEFIEISAKDDINVVNLFENITSIISQKILTKEIIPSRKDNGITIEYKKNYQKIKQDNKKIVKDYKCCSIL